MSSEQYLSGSYKNQSETDGNIEQSALRSMKAIQQFPYDSSIKISGKTLAERTQLTRILKRGACTAKHELLAIDLDGLAFPILFLTYPFLWSKLLVDYPNELKKLAGQMPLQYHLVLGLLNNNAIELIDVTWDPPLQKGGFPVGKIGHQIVSMPMAVVPENTPTTHYSAEERAMYIERLKPTIPWSHVIPVFYDKLNNWLASLRVR
jgi:hypothetical protein